jgi:hypothetical protein
MSTPAQGTDPLAVGDRVQRQPVSMSMEPSPSHTGIVTECYQSRPDGQGATLPLYAVEWEDVRYIERGYLREGLVKLEAR